MALSFFKNFLPSMQFVKLHTLLTKSYSIYEPPYLEALKPKYPIYPLLHVQVRGYDYSILESYQSWMHKIALAMDFDIEDCYAFPQKEHKIVRYKPKSEIVEVEYLLRLHERNLKISNVAGIHLPIFIRICEAGLPEGVLLDIFEHHEDKDKARYIPDKKLLDMKDELTIYGKKKK